MQKRRCKYSLAKTKSGILCWLLQNLVYEIGPGSGIGNRAIHNHTLREQTPRRPIIGYIICIILYKTQPNLIETIIFGYNLSI